MNTAYVPQIKRIDLSKPILFDCGNLDLNEFFTEDAVAYQNNLLAKTYQCLKDGKVVALFSVCNDSIPLSDSTKKDFPERKRLRSYPTVKLVRLGVCNPHQKKGIGSDILRFLKIFFIVRNKTGCRFITVDAYNKPGVIRFYEKNGLKLLTEDDKNKKTRVMFCDLLPYHNTIESMSEVKRDIENTIKEVV